MDKITTQYIQRNISQKFIETCVELSDRKVPYQAIIRGLALALAISINNSTELKNSRGEIAEIIDGVIQVLEKSQKKGVCFPTQAAALGLHIPVILGIDYADLR